MKNWREERWKGWRSKEKGLGGERKGINGVKRREEGWWIKGGEN